MQITTEDHGEEEQAETETDMIYPGCVVTILTTPMPDPPEDQL